MKNSLLKSTSKVLVALLILVSTVHVTAQSQFDNGIKKGMVKVKFTQTTTTILPQSKVNARNNRLTTGMAAFDVAANAVQAHTMYRLFPYDAKNEHKLRKHGLHLWYVIEMDESVDPKAAVGQFKKLGEVALAEVEHEKILAPYAVKEHIPGVSSFATMPFNDPLLKDQWHYNNILQTGFGNADVNLFEAWEKTTGANNIIVAIHDEGVDVNHDDLKQNVWVNQAELNGQPGVDDDNNGYIDDINGYNFAKNKAAIDPQYHGTHVAGTVAAVNNNGIGVAGVAGGNGTGNGVKIMSLQILGGSGSIERSFVYAADNGAVISQNSWGYTSPGGFDQSVLDAIDYFIAEAGDFPGSPMKGGIVIFAAGNYNLDDAWYPGYHPGVLAVTAIGPEWKKTSYSNFGTWTEIAAPGGDSELGIKNGVLSTIPGNKYAYLEGTSMACPHVSGIAALALANRTRQVTNTELWTKLLTGVVNIDAQNPDYIGKLGKGAIDAELAIRNDLGIPPGEVKNLIVTGISQEFATLLWKVPFDTDDDQPTSFNLYYRTDSITAAGLSTAAKISIPNLLAADSTFTFEVSGLLGLTKYFFAVTATDRWGNTSVLSQVVSATTNEGPKLVLDENSQEINLTINVAESKSASQGITISNDAAGILRWNHKMRHRNTTLSYNSGRLNFPSSTNTKSAKDGIIGREHVPSNSSHIRSNDVAASAFTTVNKDYTYWPTNIIGDTDIKLPNSAATKFTVTEASGFNLTDVKMYLKHDPVLGPVIMEIYEGNTPEKKNLIYFQEHSNYDNNEAFAYIKLNEQLYFEAGSTFWVVFHVPAGNKFPLGIGFEVEPYMSDNCFMSFDLGVTWAPLGELLAANEFAWAITASSYNEHLGTYLNLEPGSGDVNGFEQVSATLNADGSTLINGDYSANLIIQSNDAANQEMRVPVNLTVSGHQPKLKHANIVDYGSVFMGDTKSFEVVLENIGFGNFNDPVISTNSPSFELDQNLPWQIQARAEATVKVTFKPTAPGNTNGILTITNGSQTYEISLFGVGAETAKIAVTPESQVVDNLAIGDEISAKITVENKGVFPLKYFVPGYDTKGVSENWPSDYHNYGYTLRSNYAIVSNPIGYEFEDISGTGVNITKTFFDDASYVPVDMGFQFPYYGEMMQTLYISKKGFTVFDNNVRAVNVPSLNNSWNPRGFISILGSHFSYLTQGEIFYKVEADRVIVQYDNVWDGWSEGETITAQMVLHANGDIRFYYDDLTTSDYNKQFLTILIEDLGQSDGVLISNYEKPKQLYSGLALGLDYPGPSIISEITNGSGVLSPGASAELEIKLSTSSLSEGTVNRYISIINNDPDQRQKNALVQLNITSGGMAMPEVSADSIQFGDIFQGAIRKSPFTIKNPGTAKLSITGIRFLDSNFSFTGEQPSEIKPGLYNLYSVEVPTVTLAALEDWLVIEYGDGSRDSIYVSANVVDAPGINVDLSPISQTLAYGEKTDLPFTIENTGKAPLQVAPVGGNWMSFTSATAPSNSLPDFTYTYQKHNNGEFYQWVDIRKTGTQMSFVDYENFENTFWRELELPFPIEFYGQKYTSFKVGDNGVISFEEDPKADLFTDYIPSANHTGARIMPYWTFSSFTDFAHPKEDIGIFYQFFEDKIIITWSTFVNNFGGMGDPVSAQIFFYKDGTMKFQYKREDGGADFTSQATTIGLQRNSSDGVAISQYQALDHGTGLAYVIVPARRYTIAPGSTLSGNITLDATNIYGGIYNQPLRIHSNAPNTELLEKPVELTVTGDANLLMADSVSFESKLVAFESIYPVTYSKDVMIENDGAAAFDISYASLADGTGPLNLMVMVNGFWGPEWTRINEIWAWPTFTIKPGDKLMTRAIFSPSAEGEYSEEVILTTSLGEKRFVLTGTAFEAAKIQVVSDSIYVAMNTVEVTEQSIALDNKAGKSNLNYEVSIDYQRPSVQSASRQEQLAGKSSEPNISISSISAIEKATVSRQDSIYNRTLSHTEKENPDTFIGTGGAAPFTLSTRFNAGPEGFNLSHVETFLRMETLASAEIELEIRAGGSSIADAVLLGKGSLTITGNGSDETGDWYQIALDKPVGIYPNENFYVIVTHPFGNQFPQGTITDAENVPGRYAYLNEGQWYEVQEGAMSNIGWLMFAGEMEAGTFSWLHIKEGQQGVLAKGDSASVKITIDGTFAKEGNQLAHIVFNSNDPANPTVKVPLTLHMNEAPYFINAPISLVVAENDSTFVSIRVIDTEKDSIGIQGVISSDFVKATFEGDSLKIALTPQYGDEGNYQYKLTATDKHGAKRELVMPIEVLHTNQAPVYIGAVDAFAVLKPGILTEHDLAAYFSDPDGDEFTYSLTSSNDSVLTVFASASKFIIKTGVNGEAIMTFTVTDKFGAVRKMDMTVKVDLISGLEDLDILFSLTAYPNPTTGSIRVKVKGEISNTYSLRIINSLGVPLLLKENCDPRQETVIDLGTLPAGVYLLEVTDKRGKSMRRIVKQ
jgi:subtilisin family serine protease